MDEDLTRREKRKLFKEEQKEGTPKPESKKTIIIVVILAVLGLIGYWIYKGITTPLPGTGTADLGREHVTDVTGVAYDTNPPSSGTHFPIWAKMGLYDRVLSEGYLIHSQEHGYVVISYNCAAPTTLGLPESFLKMNYPLTDPNMAGFTPQNPPEKEVDLPEAFNSEGCKSLVNNLKKYLDVAQRIVIVPKINLDTTIALNAWDRIDKFNLASPSGINTEEDTRIVKFIKAFHNKGPEKTNE